MSDNYIKYSSRYENTFSQCIDKRWKILNDKFEILITKWIGLASSVDDLKIKRKSLKQYRKTLVADWKDLDNQVVETHDIIEKQKILMTRWTFFIKNWDPVDAEWNKLKKTCTQLQAEWAILLDELNIIKTEQFGSPKLKKMLAMALHN